MMTMMGSQEPEFMRCLTYTAALSMTINVALLHFVASADGYVNGDEEEYSFPAAVAIAAAASLRLAKLLVYKPPRPASLYIPIYKILISSFSCVRRRLLHKNE